MSQARAVMTSMTGSKVFVNASSLFGTTVITSILGFAFWAVAARTATPVVVGGASAAISVMQLVGSLGTLGLGTLLIGELGRRPSAAIPLVTAGLRVAGVAALVIGAVVGLVIDVVSRHPGALFAPGLPLVIFAVGTALTAVSSVVDQALVGLSLGARQLSRNAVFATSKLVLLVLAALTGQLSAIELYVVWGLGQVVSLVLLWARTRHPASWLTERGGIRSLRGLGSAALAHHLMNVASHAPSLLLPVIISAVLGAAANAGFYVALLLSGFAWTIPSSFSTALFAIPSNDLHALGRELRLSLKISIVISVLAAVGFAVLGPLLLSVFGSGYGSARDCLLVLGCLTFASAIKSLYVAVCRVQGRLRTAAVATTTGSILEIVSGGLGTHWGLTGVALTLGAAMVLEALIFTPTVVRAARYSDAGSPAPTST